MLLAGHETRLDPVDSRGPADPLAAWMHGHHILCTVGGRAHEDAVGAPGCGNARRGPFQTARIARPDGAGERHSPVCERSARTAGQQQLPLLCRHRPRLRDLGGVRRARILPCRATLVLPGLRLRALSGLFLPRCGRGVRDRSPGSRAWTSMLQGSRPIRRSDGSAIRCSTRCSVTRRPFWQGSCSMSWLTSVSTCATTPRSTKPSPSRSKRPASDGG